VRTITPDLWWIFLAAAGTVAILVVAFVISALVQQNRHMNAVQSFSDRLLAAHEEERALVARELHDDVLQRVAVLIGELDDKQSVPPDSREAYAYWVGEFREEVADLAEDVRSIAKRMHPAVLDHLGLDAALGVMAEEMSKTEGVQVELDIDLRHKSTALPKELTTTLYRIAQEALRNVAQHAQTDRAALTMMERDGGIELVVEDQGKGLPEGWEDSVSGLGITSMKERVRLIDGRLTVTPSALGTRIEAWVPVRRSS
jgi:signal transduction histidine kinase